MTATRRISDKPFFDSNVVVYALVKDDDRSEAAEALLEAGGVISVQVLNEVANVSRRKLGMSWADVGEALAAMRVLCPTTVPLTTETHETALRMATKYGYGMYDSLIVAAALQAKCTILYSEDLHDGHLIEDQLTIRNPFRPSP